jgi:hypothetical protein
MRRRIPRTIAAVVGQMWCQRYLMAGLVDSLRARAAAPQVQLFLERRSHRVKVGSRAGSEQGRYRRAPVGLLALSGSTTEHTKLLREVPSVPELIAHSNGVLQQVLFDAFGYTYSGSCGPRAFRHPHRAEPCWQMHYAHILESCLQVRSR